MPVNPFRPLNERQLRRQARRDLRAVYMPLARQIGQEAQAGERNVAGISGQLASQLGGYQHNVADIYQRAQQSLGSYGQAQREALGQVGDTNLADQLGRQVALSGGSPDIAANLRRTTGDVAGAAFARGGAELGALAQRQAAAEDFAAKLPGLASLAGLQGVNERAAQATAERAKLQAQIPGQIASLIQQGRNRNFQIGAANLAYQGDVYGQQQQTRRTRIQQGAQSARTAAEIASRNAIANAKLNESIRHNTVTETQARHKAARSNRTFNEQLSSQYGYLVDGQGRPILQNGKKIPYRRKRHVGGKSGGKSGGGGGGKSLMP